MSARPRASAATTALLIGLLGLGACGSASPDDDAGPAAIGDKQAHGTFQLSLVAPRKSTPGFTSMLGKSYAGPLHPSVMWEDQTGSGVCRLYVPRIPFCDPPCETGVTFCSEGDVCQPYPKTMSVGTIDVTGMAKPFAMKAINGTYQIAGVDLPYPPFAEGDELTLSAEGSAQAAAFTMRAKGIAPLVVLSDDILVDGKSTTLTWEAPKTSGASTIVVSFDISYHGGTKGKVECACPDTGAVVVPGELLTALIDLGTSGFPKVEITRLSAGTTEPAMSVKLIVQARVTKFLSVPGVISCMGQSDCPTGKTCGHDFKCV